MQTYTCKNPYLIQHAAHARLNRLTERPDVPALVRLPAVEAVQIGEDGDLGAPVNESEEHLPLDPARLLEAGPEGDDLESLTLDIRTRQSHADVASLLGIDHDGATDGRVRTPQLEPRILEGLHFLVAQQVSDPPAQIAHGALGRVVLAVDVVGLADLLVQRIEHVSQLRIAARKVGEEAVADGVLADDPVVVLEDVLAREPAQTRCDRGGIVETVLGDRHGPLDAVHLEVGRHAVHELVVIACNRVCACVCVCGGMYMGCCAHVFVSHLCICACASYRRSLDTLLCYAQRPKYSYRQTVFGPRPESRSAQRSIGERRAGARLELCAPYISCAK